MAKDVVGVVSGLDRHEPLVLGVTVGLPHAILTLVAEVVDIDAIGVATGDLLPDPARGGKAVVVLVGIGPASTARKSTLASRWL
jgi:hypothetical protein